MKDLILEHKTGFLTSVPFEIYDNRGMLFYSSDFTDHIAEGRTLKFNMPLGIYKYNGSFVKLQNPIQTPVIKLPPVERTIPRNGGYDIRFGNNPNKCTIFYEPGLILFDRKFLKEPLYIRYGIYFHELGHHYYKTEKYADLYAAKKMLDYGFNPSQVGRVVLESLDKSGSFERQFSMVQNMTKNKG